MRLLRTELLPDSGHEHIRIKPSNSPDNEESNQAKQPQPFHGERYLPVKNLASKLKRREAMF
jgi:hypothetical protein